MKRVLEIITVLIFLFCLSMLQTMDQTCCGNAYGPPGPPPPKGSAGWQAGINSNQHKTYLQPGHVTPRVKNKPQLPPAEAASATGQ
jgi:hypothetical protein